jgi:hypothetical protein
VAANYGKVPLSFEPNQGQSDPRVQFLSHGSGYSLFLTPGEVILSLEKQDGASSSLSQGQQPKAAPIDTLRMEMVGANPAASVSGADPQPGVVNYLIGSDQKKWHSGIHTFGKVNYAQVYPGVDLVFYGNQRQLEYDFVVAPGADASKIAWQIEGAAAAVDKDGNLVLTAAHGPASFKAPVIYQMDGQKRVPVDGAFEVAGDRIHFKLGSYDHARPLVIDPVLVYATYLGSAQNEFSTTDGESQIGWNLNFSASGFSSPTQGLAVDSLGDVIVTGYTDSTNFPLQDPYQTAVPGLVGDFRSFAVFVTKFNPQGTGLIYSTYLGGIGIETQSVGTSIAVDAGGNAYVAGFTDDGSFPVTAGAYQTLCGANTNGNARVNGCGFEGPVGGFVSKLDPTGQTLIYSTFLGGAEGSQIFSIAVDAQGQAYVVGNSGDYCAPTSPAYYCFPTTPNAILPGTASYVFQPSLGDYGLYTGNAFVSVFDAAGANLLYSSYIGDNTALIASGARPPGYWGLTNGNAVTVDSQGDFFVAGTTLAPDLAITAGALQTAPSWIPAECCEAFVAKFAPVASGSSLDYLSYFGGPGAGYGTFVSSLAADSEGELYIAGVSHDQDFPTTPGAFQTTCGIVGDEQCGIAFVTKLNSAGNGLVWSTMLGNEQGGSGSTVATVGPIQLDTAGNVYIIGTTSGYYPDFPQVNPIQAVTGGNFLPFITEFNPTGSQVLFSTFFGSGGLIGEQYAAGLAVDASGNIYMAGNAYTTGIPTTPGAFQANFAGTYDGYVAKIAQLLPSSTVLGVSPSPASFGQLVTLTATVSGTSPSPVPTGTVTFYNGATELGTGTLTGGVATFASSSFAPATYSLTASYASEGTYASSVSPAQSLVVNPATQTITFTGLPAAATYGSAGPYVLNASASSGLTVGYGVTGPASISGSTLTINGVGTVIVTASQGGNSDYSPATSVSQTIQVGIASQTITFTGLPAAATYGSAGPYALNGSASSGLTVGYGVTGPASISGSTLTVTGVGTVVVTASQGGNADYSPATSVSQTIQVGKASQTITFTGLPAAATFGAAGPYALNGSASSGLAVSYGVTGPASLSGSTLTITGAGTVTVTASQGGNANFSPAATVLQTIQVGKASQTITFNAIPAQTVGASLTLTASATSGLAVNFTSTSPTICTVSATTASMVGAGTCTILASQAGNANYAAAASVSQSFSVTGSAASFTIIPIPAVETITRGTLGVFILELQSVKGFNGQVTLTCSGGPVGDECVDFPQPVKVNGTAFAISGILFHPQSKPGTYTITFTGVSGSLTEKATAQFIVK